MIATTNQPLAELVEEGEFRADLFYRLNVVPFSIPPLRERREDIRTLVHHFAAKYQQQNVEPPHFSEDLLARFEAYEWPGNVRELENAVRRAIALHAGETVGPEFFEAPRAVDCVVAAKAAPPIPGTSLRKMERQLLESTLAANGGNRTRTAQELGICARTMRNKIREYGLPPRSYA